MTTAAALSPTRRERRKLEVRSRIIEAARHLFEQKGVQATTVADICDHADVAHKTFFNHFPAKQDVVKALAAVSMETLLGEIDAARRKGRTTSERLLHFFDSIARTASAAGPMHRELLTEIIHAAQQSPQEPEHARRLHDAFGTLVREGVKTGDVTRKHSVQTLTEMILGAYYVLMFDWANLDEYPIARRARAAARFLADALAPRLEES